MKKNTKNTWTRELAEIILAFVVAWLGYQLLSAATGTALPIVAVVSDSMYHTSGYNQWWDEKGKFYQDAGITKDEFAQFPFRNGLARGDLLLVLSDKPKIGDVVIYQRRDTGISIVHRLISDGDALVTKGDNNAIADQPIQESDIIGKVVFAVPLLGYPRFILFMFGI